MTIRLRSILRAAGFKPPGRATVPAHWRHLAQLLDQRGITCVLDVGANTGQYARGLRRAGYAGRVVSFEPLSEAHATLAAAARKDADWIVAPRLALAAASGNAEINVSAESDMSSLLPFRDETMTFSPSSRYVGREEVPVEPIDAVFDDYVRSGERVFVKLDTQGSESAILDGAAESLPRISGLQLELSLVPLYEGELGWRAMVAWLAQAGFAPYLFIPGYYSRHLGRMLQFDGVFLRNGAQDEAGRT